MRYREITFAELLDIAGDTPFVGDVHTQKDLSCSRDTTPDEHSAFYESDVFARYRHSFARLEARVLVDGHLVAWAVVYGDLKFFVGEPP